jgi:RHS repeat-associated protein
MAVQLVRRAAQLLVTVLVASSIAPIPFADTGFTTLGNSVLVASVSSGTTTRVSTDSSGVQANGESAYNDISGNGRYVVFESRATNLVAGDTNGKWDIFLRDRQTGATTRISVSTAGTEANGDSNFPRISADGTAVTFQSTATNLVDGDTNAQTDIFVRDLVTNTTTRIVSTSGVQGNGSSSGWATMTSDGRYVAFTSFATNFGGDVDGVADIYLNDRVTGATTQLVYQAFQAAINTDGQFVAFTTGRSLVPADTNSSNDTYVLDRNTGAFQLASISLSGGASNGRSDGVSISGDGHLVAFSSLATNLVASDTNGSDDVFVRDLSAGTTTMASVTSAGAQPGGASNYPPRLSRDGRFVAFRSSSALDAADTNGMVDVYARDLSAGETILVSVATGGALGNNWSEYPSVSDNGLVIAFWSYASNLVSGDTNATRDIYVHDRSGPAPDTGTAVPFSFGHPMAAASSLDPVNLATGSFTSHGDDLVMPGRVLGLAFTRWYNSADDQTGPLGPAWTHSYNWTLTDAGATVDIRRGDGRRDTFTRNPDATYAHPPDTFDVLVKNGDGTFTLTLTSQVQYEFSTIGKLTRIHEPAGNQILFAYTVGNLTTLTDSVGRQVALSYDGSNRLTQVQDPLGRKVTYTYDASGRLSTVTDNIGNAVGQNPALHRWTYGYDGSSRHITTITDPDGRVRVTNIYDSQGRVYQQRDGLSALTQIAYTTGQTTLTDPRNHATVYQFDNRMRVLSQSDTVGANTYTISYVYDAVGNRTSVTDRNGKTTDFTYDGRGNLLTKTDPQIDPQTPRYLTQFVYDAKNNLTQITDPLSFVTTMTYDPTTNLLLSVSRQIDATTYATTKYEYLDVANPGLPTRAIAPRGNTGPTPNYLYSTSLTYDAQGNLTQRIDPDGAKTTYAYDGVGRLTSFVDPDGYAAGATPSEHTWTVAYDENDRETGRTDPLGNSLGYGYDGAGDRTSVTDRRGNTTTYTYDANTRLATTQQRPDPLGQPTLVYTTTVTRDGNGNATRMTQANGVITDYAFDALDRLSSVTTHPDAQTSLVTSYVLDGNGQPLTRTTGDGVTVTYGYDALSRITSVAAPGLTTITYGYDAASRRTQMVDGTGTTTYQYDGLGRVGQIAAPNGTLAYLYDLDGNRTTLGYPGSQNVTYAYSPGGRLNTVTDWASRISTYTYKSSGLVATLQYPNTMLASYTYDRAQRLTQITNAVGATTVTQHTYTLDAEGNRTALDEYVQGITPPVLTWSASVQVNSVATGTQDHPAIALGADGASYLLWDDSRSGNADIYFARRDPATGAWSTNQKVNSDTGTRPQSDPAVATDDANNAYAVWKDNREGSNNSQDANIYFSKRTASTGVWSANVRVNNDTQGSPLQAAPRIAVKSTGDAVAVWEDHRSNQWNVYSSRLAAGASTWGSNLRVTDNTSSNKFTPDVAVGTDGSAYAVWEDNRSGNADIWFSTLAPGSSIWSANTKISDDPGSSTQTKPRIGVDAVGNLLVVWVDYRVSGGELRSRKRAAVTSTWEASVVVSSLAQQPDSPALAVRSDGEAYLTWQDARFTPGGQPQFWKIVAAQYSVASGTWNDDASLGPEILDSTDQLRSAVALGASEVALAWRDNLSSTGDIRVRRRTTANGSDHFALTYDAMNRLTSVVGPAAESFNFDGASNVTSRTGPSATNAYDLANRQTSDGARSFAWNGADRLTGRGSDSFSYDALARLTSATVAGVTRTYTYNGDGLLSERPETNLLWDASAGPAALLKSGTDQLVYGHGPLYVVRADGSTIAFGRDALGSTRVETDTTASVSRSFRYAAYGAVVQSFGGAPTLLGHAAELVDASGLTYLRARWYDASTGRFMSSDPVSGSSDLPTTLNRFGYANANPAMNTDPAGLCTGGGNVIYCIERWIPTALSCPRDGPFCGTGDDRWWPSPFAGTFKVQTLVKANGEISTNVGFSQLTLRNGLPVTGRGRGDLSDCGGSFGHGTVVTSCNAENAYAWTHLAPGPIRTRVEIITSPDGRPIVHAFGTLYPSLAVYKYGSDGPQLLYFYDGKAAGLDGLGSMGILPNVLDGK